MKCWIIFDTMLAALYSLWQFLLVIGSTIARQPVVPRAECSCSRWGHMMDGIQAVRQPRIRASRGLKTVLDFPSVTLQPIRDYLGNDSDLGFVSG